jgi:hypothetical protein
LSLTRQQETDVAVPVMVSPRMRDELRHVAYEMEVTTGQQVTDDEALEYLLICREMRWL